MELPTKARLSVVGLCLGPLSKVYTTFLVTFDPKFPKVQSLLLAWKYGTKLCDIRKRKGSTSLWRGSYTKWGHGDIQFQILHEPWSSLNISGQILIISLPCHTTAGLKWGNYIYTVLNFFEEGWVLPSASTFRCVSRLLVKEGKLER